MDLPGQKNESTNREAYNIFKRQFNGHSPSPDTTILNGLHTLHPDHHITAVITGYCDLLSYADAGHAKAELDNDTDGFQARRVYRAASRRLDESTGTLSDRVSFGKYHYVWQEQSYLVYRMSWSHEVTGDPIDRQFLLSPWVGNEKEGHSPLADELILAAGKWSGELHNEIYVFDNGHWFKNKDLWESVQKASWNDVILEEKMKKTIANDIEGFFDRKDLYTEFAVPWKRGIILHGPPGNGKTVSLKAVMHNLSARPDPIPALYVKSLEHCKGPQVAVRSIFSQARDMAPCLLVFEDIDSLVTDKVRSYFLNEVDGIEAMDGIMMIGSTNHLDKLDPAIAKRPSRFDRKYAFTLPAEPERAAYCDYSRAKLASNPAIEFPLELSPAIAKITDAFSFAYLKELFITSLLLIARAREHDEPVDGSDDGDERDVLRSCPLGRVIKSQVQILRDDMESGSKQAPKVDTGERMEFAMLRDLMQTQGMHRSE
ncbi:MAG: hypothetical protein M1833_001859 [Piccolia ochrophora]|nr:MAG: hypothetical protein M1833_001859 [Piccolia ochrophora]